MGDVMAGADRAINMAVRVRGVGDVERDFRRVGNAGEKSFSQIEKSANGAAREVSDYTARLKRAAASARADVANMPDMWKGDALDAVRRRNAFVLERVNSEKGRIRSGLPDLTLPGAADGAREAGLFAAALEGVGGAAGIASLGLTVLVGGIGYSVAAFNEHERALAKFNATLSYSGNLSGASAQQIAGMADRVSQATLQTQESVLGAATQLARVPFITGQALEEALEASARFADAMEEDVNATAERTAAVFSALANNDIKGLVKAMEGLDGATAANILSLAEAGKTAEAQRAYLNALTDAAGDGPGGTTRATDRLSDSWRQMVATFGSLSSGPVESVLGGIASALDWVTERAGIAAKAVQIVLTRQVNIDVSGGPPVPQDPLPDSASAAPGRALGFFASAQALLYKRRADGILNPSKPPRSGGGGRRGGGGQSEAEKLAREAEQARGAADKVSEANNDIVESYRRRAEEAAARLGLEGAALEAVIRHQEIETVVRRLSTDEIEKQVAAERAAAKAAGRGFDEAAATAAATEALQAKIQALRDHAAAEYDANEAQKDFIAQEERAQAIWDATRTPQERIKRELASATDALRNGTIDQDTFNRYARQLAEDWVDAADRIGNAWRGMGDDVRTALGDIIVRGGSAKEILKELVQSVALRVFDQNVGNPIANWIDGFTGNNREKNVDEVAARFTSGAVDRLGVNADLAAGALGRIAGVTTPLDNLTGDIGATSQALRDCLPEIGGFEAGLAGIFDAIARAGGGGGGGLFGSILGAGISILGGGSKIGITNGGFAIKAAGKTGGLPGFAGGGEPPIGMPFTVGENGLEHMYLMPGGGARVIGGEQSRRMGAGGPPTINITVSGARGNSEIRQMVSDGVSEGIARYDREVGGRVQENLARYGQ